MGMDTGGQQKSSRESSRRREQSEGWFSRVRKAASSMALRHVVNAMLWLAPSLWIYPGGPFPTGGLAGLPVILYAYFVAAAFLAYAIIGATRQSSPSDTPASPPRGGGFRISPFLSLVVPLLAISAVARQLIAHNLRDAAFQVAAFNLCNLLLTGLDALRLPLSHPRSLGPPAQTLFAWFYSIYVFTMPISTSLFMVFGREWIDEDTILLFHVLYICILLHLILMAAFRWKQLRPEVD